MILHPNEISLCEMRLSPCEKRFSPHHIGLHKMASAACEIKTNSPVYPTLVDV